VLAEMHASRPQTHDRPQAGARAAGRAAAAAGRAGVAPQPRHLRPGRDPAAGPHAEELPALYRDNAMRAIEAARFPGSNREDAQESVERLLRHVTDDRQGLLARRILATGSPGYSRVFGRALASGNPGVLSGHDAQILALGEATGRGRRLRGALPARPDHRADLDGSRPTRSGQLARVERIVGKEYDLVSSAGVTVTRVAEATPAPDASPTLAQPKVRTERVQGFIPFSVELEGDWTACRRR
jgi:hypothetical protein